MSPKRSPGEIKEVPVDLIRPGSQQARRYFNPEALAELAESIKDSGVVQPIVLRTRVWGYELLAGLHEIPAVIRDDLSDDEAYVLGLIENLQRESLTPMETAQGMKRLVEAWQMTHEQVGARIGKSREYVTNHLRLLNLAPEVQAMVNEGLVPLSHAKVLAGLPLPEQGRLAVAVASGKLTVRALERKVAAQRADKFVFRPAKPGDWRALESRLSDQLGYPVTISSEKAGRGELRIRFHSLDELDGILARIGYDAG